MEININVDEVKFKEILQEELNAFSKEELHEICREGLIKCMSDPNTFKNLFTYNSDNQYYRNDTVANDILKRAAETVNMSNAFKEFEAKAIEYLKENNRNIIEDMVFKIMREGLVNTMTNSYTFRETLLSAIYQNK